MSSSYGVHAAKTNLSKILDIVATGQTVTITNGGEPVAQVIPIPPAVGDILATRTGFLPVATVPADFDTMGDQQIRAAFEDDA